MKRDRLIFLLSITFVFILSNLILLVSPGVWWDDWIIYNTGPDFKDLIHFYESGGATYLSPILIFFDRHIPLSYLPQFYHLLVFVISALILIMTDYILKWFKLPISWRQSILLLAASSPLFMARFSISCFIYSICAVFFFLGSVLMLHAISSRKVAFRILSLVSFFTSILFWYVALAAIPVFVIIVALYLYQEEINWKSWESLKKVGLHVVRKWWDFLLVPVFAFITRAILFPSTGTHVDYYAITFHKLIKFPLNLLISFFDSTIGSLGGILFSNFIVGTFFIIILAIAYLTSIKLNIETDREKSKYLFYAAICLFFAGILTTSIINPTRIFDFRSRYQAMAVIPVAILFFTFILQLNSAWLRRTFLALIIAIGITANMEQQLVIHKEWVKADAFMEMVRNEPAFQQDFTNILIKGEFNRYCVDYNCMVKTALNGNQTHFCCHKEDIGEKIAYPYSCNESRNIGHYDLCLTLTEGDMALNRKNTLTLLYQYYFNPAAYRNNLRRVWDYNLQIIENS